jgi:hypothetical protein
MACEEFKNVNTRMFVKDAERNHCTRHFFLEVLHFLHQVHEIRAFQAGHACFSPHLSTYTTHLLKYSLIWMKCCMGLLKLKQVCKVLV